MVKRYVAGFVVLVCLLSQSVLAFGPKGHELVGTIADRLLTSKPASAKIKILLEGVSLADAARIADDIKGLEKKNWDGEPVATLPWTMTTNLRRDMYEFLKANSNSHGGHGHNPDHHSFHYTDISVVSDLKYDIAKKGAGKTDVVQMINYCIGVLKGTNPQPNQYAITPRVAVVLLAHYLGDIHQPLHVGAAYFDATGARVDPDVVPSAKADHGGNDIQMHPAGSSTSSLALHAFWDDRAVDAAIHGIKLSAGSSTGGTLTVAEIDTHFVTAAPAGAPLDAGVPIEKLSVTWANEILPISKKSHE
ncbi:MAG: phospholipase, partial [Planctomycetaceae bacterium]|nr:phospholipase [Planctomycetaceae bacterium]